MGRRKGSLNKSTLAKMGLNNYKNSHQNDGKKVQNYPQNDGKPKRVRRTREQLIADGYYDKDKSKVKNKKTLEKFLDSKPIKNNTDVKPKRHRRTKKEMLEAKKQMEELEAKLRSNVNSATEKVEMAKESVNSMKTMEQICEEQLEKAKRENYPQPDFDYRNDYFKGQSVYYIKVNELCGKKEIVELKISSVYPRLIIGYEDRGMSHCIGFDESDMIFFTLSECEQVFKNLVVENKLEDYMQRQKQLANKKRLEALKKGEKNG